MPYAYKLNCMVFVVRMGRKYVGHVYIITLCEVKIEY